MTKSPSRQHPHSQDNWAPGAMTHGHPSPIVAISPTDGANPRRPNLGGRHGIGIAPDDRDFRPVSFDDNHPTSLRPKTWRHSSATHHRQPSEHVDPRGNDSRRRTSDDGGLQQS